MPWVCKRWMDMDKTVHSQYKLNPKPLSNTFPDGPGIYMFKDSSDSVIYVGKARNLKKRVSSYLKQPEQLPGKTGLMMKRACTLDFMLTSTENEAFILESNLIKEFLPRYNIVLRDDKQYPCLRLNIKEPYPRLNIVRKIKKDNALYFGPFSSSSSVRDAVKVIDRVFHLRKCKGGRLPKRSRPCLNYQMGRCLGPCTFDISVSKYQEVVQKVRCFLEGRNRELIDRLKNDMAERAEHLDFEKAAMIRDQISAIKKIVERQHMVSKRMEDQDIIGLANMEDLNQVVIIFVRKGAVIGSRNYLFRNPGGDASEVMEALLKQYYLRESFIPEQIFISEKVDELISITEWLSHLAGKRILIHRPVRGEKFRLVKMAVKNGENLLKSCKNSQQDNLMNIVQSALRLKRIPRVIEGLDISNLHGDMTVGAIVSFVDGFPNKSAYRNYKIKAAGGMDDYGMMAELVKRRALRGGLPDLFLVDGGKGHLSVVKRTLDGQQIPAVFDVASIAKPDEKQGEKHDKIYIPGQKNPLRLRRDDPVLLLMMRIRDEAHRRAISYNRKLRNKRLTESDLDRIPGIGAKRKKLLLRHFKEINTIAKSRLDELTEIPGINLSLAENIKAFFQ